jgi:hypothetical protein
VNRPKPKEKPRPSEAPVDVEFEKAPQGTGRDVVQAKGVTPESKTMVVQMHESELNTRLMMAERRPRVIMRCMERMHEMATMTEEAAESMSYDVPRDGKIISGASIRFAEIAQLAWTNGHSDAYVVEINKEEMYVAVKGVYLDLETNVSFEEPVRRSLRNKEGKLYSPDMINTTANAACAIAKREAILAGVPRAAWTPAWKAARRKAAGSKEELPRKRQEMLKHFMEHGIGPDRVLLAVGLRTEAQITADHIAQLRGMWVSLDSGEAMLEELFPLKANGNGDKQSKKRKTLHDLGEDEATIDEANRAEDIQAAMDAGREGFHKGMEGPPERFQRDAGLAHAWREGFQEAKDGAAEAGDEEGLEEREYAVEEDGAKS